MKATCRRWFCGLLAGLLALLGLCAAVVYRVDPCFYYRLPQEGGAFFNERYQAAGMIRNVRADTVLLGTSMAANYRASWIGETFGGTGLRITIPDGYLSEFDQAVELLFRTQDPQRVIFGLDLNILVRDESGLTGAMPDYLYNKNPVDDVRYLLNKDTLYYSLYTIMTELWGTEQSLDEGFTWGEGIWWNHLTALDNYERPEPAGETLPPDTYLDEAAGNLAVVEQWVTAHPDTQFDIFFPPYSILFWDKAARQGTTDAMLSALELAVETLTSYENVRVYGFLLDEDIVMNLDYYCDYVHHSGQVSRLLLRKLAADEERLTEENIGPTLENWRGTVGNYDYEKFWDESFWVAWNASHSDLVGAKSA